VKEHQDRKIEFDNGQKQILQMHQAGAGGIQVVLALTRNLDALIKSIFDTVQKNKNHLTIIALGGYGRKELNFSSDVDVMFLIQEENHRQESTPAVQEILHGLLNIGLNVGHSFRTMSECIALPDDDFESQISLLEARFICGNQSAYRQLVEQIQKNIKASDRISFARRLFDSQFERHRKYGNSSKLLEPNIKNSSGGLRDIHTAFWMLRGAGFIQILHELNPAETAILNMLKSDVVKQQFTRSFLKDTKRAFDILLRIRNEMHAQSQSLHDTLEFGLQPQIASHLKHESRSKGSKVERFMQDYYVASKSVEMFCSRIIERTKDRLPAENIKSAKSIRSGDFLITGRIISLPKRNLQITNAHILQALLLRSEHQADFSFKLEDSIHKRLKFLKPLRGKSENNLFRFLMLRPNGIANALQKINELGLLEKWIPEWKPMVSFFQHNQYHFYTADAHTLIALKNAEALEHSDSTFGKVFRTLPRRDTLYFACLLHDIAKPIHIGKHEIRGVRIARRVLKRLRYEDILDDVAFLVRNHLLMEQVAFRRNLEDPQTIIDFVRTFDRVEQLDYLYVLTYADLSAVNKNVLTEWKEHLLWNLYRKARQVLEEEMTSEQIHERSTQQAEKNKEGIFRYLVPEFPPEEVNEHIEMLADASYVSAFKSYEIENHLRVIRRQEPVTVLFQKYENYTEVTFVARDAPGVLSKLCGVLTANDVNILDAQVFTRRDGIVIDKFRTVEFVSRSFLSEEICKKVSDDIKEVINGKIDLARLIERHKMRWKRRTKPLNPNIRCDVEFEEHPQFTIIDIYAPDMLGFLYRITEKISHLDLNITFAKIGTRIDGIVDSFYLLDSNGKKLDDPKCREAVRQEILSVIRELCNSQLVLSTL
jgi:[protein-PII] uridylyltransferase